MRALSSSLGLLLIALGAIGCGGDEGSGDAGPSPRMDARVPPRVDTGTPVPVDAGNVPGDDGGPPGFDSGPPQPCESAGTIETVSCGRCGSVERFCTAGGVWAYGDCEGQGGCEPGAMSEVTCGDCGTQMARCTDACEWEPTEECSDEGECTPGTRTRNGVGCGPGETREVTCTDTCELAPAGECESDECDSPGSIEDVSCGSCGTQTRFCTVDGVWEYGLCEDEPEDACVPGTIEPMECGMCGSRTRRCLASCTWDESGSCTGEGVCAPGATMRSSEGCDPGETKLLRCSNACAFVEEEACSDATSALDVTLLLDMTGSHATRVQDNVSILDSRLVAPLLALGDVAVGVSSFADFAGSDDTGGWPFPFDAGVGFGGDAGAGPGSPGDRPFHGGIAPTLSRSAIMTELGEVPVYNGGDLPESGVEALFILGGGTPHASAIPLSCPSGRTPGGCWRSGSTRVIVIYSDASFHNGPDPDSTGIHDPYISALGAASWSSTRSRLLADGTRVIFLHYAGTDTDAGPQYDEMLVALGQPTSDRIDATGRLGAACDEAVARIRSLAGL